MRDAYTSRRRASQPRYFPDQKSELTWDSIADYCAERQIDLELYVEAQFYYCTSGQFPWPNMFKSEQAVRKYEDFIRAKITDENPALAMAAEQQGLPGLKAEKYRHDWHSYERYIRQLSTREPSIKKLLMDETIPLAAWFRVLYCLPTDDEIKALYLDEAREEVRSNVVLQSVLKERNIDVSVLL